MCVNRCDSQINMPLRKWGSKYGRSIFILLSWYRRAVAPSLICLLRVICGVLQCHSLIVFTECLVKVSDVYVTTTCMRLVHLIYSPIDHTVHPLVLRIAMELSSILIEQAR